MSMFKIAWVLTISMMIFKIIGFGFMASVSWWAVLAPVLIAVGISLAIGAISAIIVILLAALSTSK